MLGVDAEPGVYLRTLSELFRAIEARGSAGCSVSMSYLEVSRPPPLSLHRKPLGHPQTLLVGTLSPQGVCDLPADARPRDT